MYIDSVDDFLSSFPRRMAMCVYVTLCVFVSPCSLVSVIRGQVLTADGTPLIGVNVSFLHYPEYGYTISRQDGM